MFDFGLGGLGGIASSFPQRFGAPVSNAVQSDHEWTNEWQNRLAAVPENLTFRNAPTQLVVGGDDYDRRTAAPYHGEIRKAQADAVFSGAPEAAMGGLGAAFNLATKSGIVMTPDGRGGFTLGRDPYSSVGGYSGGSHTIAPKVATYQARNPEYDRIYGQFQEEGRLRGETQTRNQQAYDGMVNGGQLNGLIGPDYANANFGSVTGQGPTQIPQIDGVNMDWAQGVYDPSQASGLFGNTGKARNTGNWL